MHSDPQSLSSDFVLVPKQSLAMFIITELCVYLSQVVMFFFVAMLASNLLRDEAHLVAYMNSKVNTGTIYEIIATMLAIVATVGMIAAISKAAPKSSLLERVADEVLAEAPRTAYVFGSGLAGTMFAVALYLHNHPADQSVSAGQAAGVGLLWSAIGFLYGCSFAYAFKHKTNIKHTPNPASTSAP